MSETRCTCGNGCATFGECLRRKSISFVGCFPTKSVGAGRGDATAQKFWDKEIDAYKDAHRQGIRPAGTQMHQIEQAVRISNERGGAYDAASGTVTT